MNSVATTEQVTQLLIQWINFATTNVFILTGNITKCRQYTRILIFLWQKLFNMYFASVNAVLRNARRRRACYNALVLARSHTALIWVLWVQVVLSVLIEFILKCWSWATFLPLLRLPGVQNWISVFYGLYWFFITSLIEVRFWWFLRF